MGNIQAKKHKMQAGEHGLTDHHADYAKLLQRKLCELSPGDPELAVCLKTLFGIFTENYKTSEDVEVFEAALKCGHAAASGTVEGHPDLPSIHQSLYAIYDSRYRKTGELMFQEAAHMSFLAAINATPEDHSNIPGMLQYLGSSYQYRYSITGDLKDLESAVKYFQASPEVNPDLPGMLKSLGTSYRYRYTITEDLKDLESAIKYFQATINAPLEGDLTLPDIYKALGLSYRDRHTRTGDPKDLDAAVKHLLLALDAIPLGDVNLPGIHQYLSLAYRARYYGTGDLKDLDAAVKHSLGAVNATPEGHSNLPALHHNLGGAYGEKYQRTEDLKDLEGAIKYFLVAVNATPEGHPLLPSMLQGLGSSYDDRHIRTGDLEDLEIAIDYTLAAVNASPEGHPSLIGMQRNLGASYGHRYRRIGDLNDLEAAIGCSLSAINAAPQGHSSLPGLQQNLGEFYHDRYRRIGDSVDLEAAIKCFMAAANMTPAKHHSMAAIHQQLGTAHDDKYQRTGDLKDQTLAVKHFQSAINATPKGHPNLPGMHHNLGSHYGTKYRQTEDLKDLESAMEQLMAAVDASPDKYPELAALHKDLGVSYADKYRETEDWKDLEAGIEHCLLAVNATPETHPRLPQWQGALAGLYVLRYSSSTAVDDLDKAYKLYKSAFQSQTATPQLLWQISVLFSSQMKYFTVQQMLEGYNAGFNILPSLLWLGSPLKSRQDTLIRNDVPTFISRAVSTALQASDTQLAVTFLEQGLSTAHKQSLQLRDEHTTLQAKSPVLFKKLHDLSVQLWNSSHTTDPAANYHILAHERQQLISKIRQQSGFEDFLLPPKYASLSTAAENGPVVMLSCNDIQTDAIIILPLATHPLHLCLPDVSVTKVAVYMEQLKNALNHFEIHSREIRLGRPHKIDNISSGKLLGSVTSWLWIAVVKPIFDLLHKNGFSDGRLWWCPSGPFTYLPLHAAAPLESSFIQSYTPTLEALVHANQKHDTLLHVPDLLAAVGVVEASASFGSWSALPSVEKELYNVTEIFQKKAQQLRDSQATVESVVKAIQSSAWLHLACHGQQDLSDPLKSGLLLYDGRLELTQILNLNLSNAKFVYLSACETAMGDSKLSNEAMHLAGGFLAAGFQGAIGTLWSMADAHGPKVAEVVYKTILGEDNIPDIKMASYGLHLAIQELRREGTPLHQWMPFIHFGI